MPKTQWQWKKCRSCGEYKRVCTGSPSSPLAAFLSSVFSPPFCSLLCYLTAPLPFIPISFSLLCALPLSLSLLWISRLFFCTPISCSPFPSPCFSLTSTLLLFLFFFLFPTFAEIVKTYKWRWYKWVCAECLFYIAGSHTQSWESLSLSVAYSLYSPPSHLSWQLNPYSMVISFVLWK